MNTGNVWFGWGDLKARPRASEARALNRPHAATKYEFLKIQEDTATLPSPAILR
jgi:hypothetical protein